MVDRHPPTSSNTRSLLVAVPAAIVLLAALLPAVATAGSPTAAAPRPGAEDSTRERIRVVRATRPGRPLMVTGKRGFLGLDLLELTPELRRHFEAGGDAGVLVAHVESGSPAALAGIAVGDVLVSIDGKPVKSSWGLRDLIAPRKAGETVTLEVVRAGARRQMQATLIEREGRVLELGRLMEGHLLPGEDGDDTVVVMPNAKDWEQFGEDMGRWGEQLGSELAEAFSNPEVRRRIGHEVEERERLQQKLEALERRLRDLEKRLAEQHRR